MPTVRDKEARLKLVDRLNSLTGNETPKWGKMNADQMMSHLVQGGELAFTESLADKSTFLMRTIVKPLILYVLPMPKEVKVTSDFDQNVNGRKPVEFSADRHQLIDLINKLGELPLDHDCKKHPMFGKLSAKEWATLAHKHIDHHLRQFGA